MQRFYDQVRDQFGNAVEGASVSVYVSGTSTLASIYDSTLATTLIANPITTGSNGEFGFAASDGRYDIELSGGSFSSKTYYGLYLYDGLTGTAGTGTVTSVALGAPAIFSVSGSPVTGAGTLTLALATQTANTVWCGPASGSAASPTFRALTADDIPNLNLTFTVPAILSVSGSPADIGGTVAIALATQSANTVLCGPASGAATTPAFRALVPADVPTFVASGASHAAGLVPDPPSTAGTAKYLREDATWARPSQLWIWSQTAAAAISSVATGTGTFSPTGVGSLTIPASTLQVGSIIKIRTIYYVDPGATSTMTFTVTIGSDTSTSETINMAGWGPANIDLTWTIVVGDSSTLYRGVAGVAADNNIAHSAIVIGATIQSTYAGSITLGSANTVAFGASVGTEALDAASLMSSEITVSYAV
jgi:hypothetical protein